MQFFFVVPSLDSTIGWVQSICHCILTKQCNGITGTLGIYFQDHGESNLGNWVRSANATSVLSPPPPITKPHSANVLFCGNLGTLRTLYIFFPHSSYLTLCLPVWAQLELLFFATIFPTTFYRGAGIRTHVSRVAPDWDL